jgi:signal transduction histidine kinase
MNPQFAPADAPVLVVEPAAGDEPAVSEVLARAGLAVETCRDLDAALARLGAAGALVIGEEALTGPAAARLAGFFESRPAWQAPPLVVMTRGGELRESGLSGASIILADLPVRPTILVSAVRAALRERRHVDAALRDAERRARLETGEDCGLLRGIAYDVTERKRAEQRLFETNQRLQALMQSLPVGVSFSDDTSCQRVTGNPMLLAQFEMSPRDNVSASAPEETAAGRQVRYFHASQELGGAELPLQRAVAENRVIPPIELEILLPSGRRWFAEVSGAPLRDARGTVIGGLAVIADITQRKHAEEALRKSEERLLLAQAASGLGIYDYDVVTGEIRWDARMRELWGVGPGVPIRAETALDALHPDDRAPTQALIDKALDPAGDGRYYAEYRIVHPGSSTVRWVAATGKVSFENRRPVRFLGTVQDITAHKLAENRLRELNAELAALLAERTRVAEKRTAELRELARDLTRAEQRERDRLSELLHDNVQPLLVAGRLALSALDERTPMEKWMRVTTQTVRLIGEALETARSLGAELNPPVIRDQGLGPALDWLRQWVQARHRLEVVLDRDPAAEPADLSTRLLCFKAVRELLLNAAKHAGADRVELRTRREDDGMLRITVADSGSGFDPAILTAANGGGVGSGLGNIERRLGMIGGRMQIGSRPGEGTAVTLLVPLQSSPPADVAAPVAGRGRTRAPRAKKAAGEPPRRQ